MIKNSDAASSSSPQPAVILENALNNLRVLIPELPSSIINADAQQSLRNIIEFSRELSPKDSRHLRYALARWYAWGALLQSGSASDPKKNKEFPFDRERDADKVWVFLKDFFTNPTPEWIKLYSVFSECLYEYVIDPAYNARNMAENILTNASEAEPLWKQCLLKYGRAETHYRNVRQLQDELRMMEDHPYATLIMPQCDEYLKEAEKQIFFVGDALLFCAWLKLPDTLLDFLDSPPGEDPCIVTMGYSRLILALRNNPDLFNNGTIRGKVQAWIQNTVHTPLLAQTLDRMLESAAALSVSADQNPAPGARYSYINNSNVCNQVVLFFYRMLSQSADPAYVALSEQLVFRAWRYHRVSMMLASTGDNQYVDAGNVLWYRENQGHFFMDYAVIADTWARMLLSVAREKASQEESGERAWLRKNLFDNLNQVMTIEYNSMLYGLYQNKQLPPVAAIERLQALLDATRTLPEAQQYADFLDAFQEKVNELIFPTSPYVQLELLHALWTSEKILLSTLAQPMSNSCTQIQQDALQESRELRATLVARLQNGGSLLDVAGLIICSLPALIANLSSSTLEHRVSAVAYLEDILSLCDKKEYQTGFQASLLQNLLPLLLRHLDNTGDVWSEAFAEKYAGRFEALQLWLETPDNKRILPPHLAKLLEHVGFLEHFAFQMKDKWNSTDLLASGVLLLKLLSINPESDVCQAVFTRFVSHLSTQYETFALEKTTAALQIYRGILLEDKNFEQHITTAPNLKKKYLLPVLLSLHEAALKLADNDIAGAGKSVNAAENEYLPRIKKYLTEEQLTEVLERIGQVKTDITCMHIQAFMRKPVTGSGHGVLMPQPGDSHQHKSFQNAWSALSAGTITSREEADNIHRAWLVYFEQCSIPAAKKPIITGWNKHFMQFCDKMDKAEQLMKKKAEKAASVTTSQAAAAVVSTSAQKTQVVKQHQPPKAASRKKQKGKKPAAKQGSRKTFTSKTTPAPKAVSEPKAAAPVLNVVPVPENAPVPAPEAAPVLEIAPIPDNTPVHTFPQLPPDYCNPPFAQDTLERLEKAGYQAYLVGGFVRDTLLGRPYKDIDLITNCPPDKLQEIFSEAWPNATYIAMFNRPKIGDVNERAIDIICCHASTPEGFVANLDFTINAFLVTSKHELLIPLPRSVDDLRTQTVRTIVPVSDSLYTDAQRIFKLINLANRLQQPLDEPQKEAILATRHKLHSLNFYEFLKNFQSCFVDSSVARENLTRFLDFNLLPAFFDKPSKTELAPKLRVFVEETFDTIQKGADADKFIDALALFSLTLMKPEAEIQETVQQWLNETIKPSDREKGIFRSLTRLPARIHHYASRSPISYEPVQPVAPVMPPNPYLYGYYPSMPPKQMVIPIAPVPYAPPHQSPRFFGGTQATRGGQQASSSSKDDAARFDAQEGDQARNTFTPRKPFSSS